MWRLFKFQETFRARRMVGKGFITGLVDKILKYCQDIIINNKLFETDQQIFQFDNVYIPALNEDGTMNNDLIGIVFLKYDEKYDTLVVQALKINKIWYTDIVSHKDLENIKNGIQEANKIEEETDHFPIGAVITIKDGDFKGLIGTIHKKINDNLFSVNIQIFGQEQLINLNKDLIDATEI